MPLPLPLACCAAAFASKKSRSAPDATDSTALCTGSALHGAQVQRRDSSGQKQNARCLLPTFAAALLSNHISYGACSKHQDPVQRLRQPTFGTSLLHQQVTLPAMCSTRLSPALTQEHGICPLFQLRPNVRAEVEGHRVVVNVGLKWR